MFTSLNRAIYVHVLPDNPFSNPGFGLCVHYYQSNVNDRYTTYQFDVFLFFMIIITVNYINIFALRGIGDGNHILLHMHAKMLLDVKIHQPHLLIFLTPRPHFFDQVRAADVIIIDGQYSILSQAVLVADTVSRTLYEFFQRLSSFG